MAKSFGKLSKITFLVILIMSISLLIYAYTLPEAKASGYLTRMSLPKFLLYIMIALSALLTYQEWRLPKKIRAEAEKEIEKNKEINESLWPPTIVFFTTIIYAIFFEDLGFMVTSIICSLITLKCFQVRSWLIVILYSVFVPLIMLLLFRYALGLPIPASPFTHYF